MKTPTKLELIEQTKQFFTLHWNIEIPYPCWDFSWNWRGPVPNYLLGGVYALFSEENLLYLGLGASRGNELYQDRGISRRLIAHIIRRSTDNPEADYILRERWEDMGANLIATIGFPMEYNYLAPALEDYLIGKLNPAENAIKRKAFIA